MKPLHSFIPYGRQEVTQSDIDAVVNVLQSSHLTQGPVNDDFESCLSKKVKSKFAATFNSATSALHVACLALGLSEGDWLWTTSITFVASSNCGLYCGANVDFVDINPRTGLMSLEQLEQKLILSEKTGKLPKVVVVVHLTGSCVNMKRLKILSKKFNFYIIEDASHALGAKYLDEYIGGCKYSDICIFSLHPVKIITSGEGGVFTTNNPNLIEKAVELRSHGITKNQNKFFEQDPGLWHYEQHNLGFNYRMSDLNAALGLSQLTRLDDIVIERNKLLKSYDELLSASCVSLLEIPEHVVSSVHLAVIQLKDKSKEFHKKLFEAMRQSHIGVQLHYSPVHLQPYYKNLGFKKGDLVASENYAHRSFSIPLFPGLTYDEQLYVIDQLKLNILKLEDA